MTMHSDDVGMDPTAGDPFFDDAREHEKFLKEHEEDPCDTPLNVKIQALTMERLNEYCKAANCSIEEAVNNFILDALYEEGC